MYSSSHVLLRVCRGPGVTIDWCAAFCCDATRSLKMTRIVRPSLRRDSRHRTVTGRSIPTGSTDSSEAPRPAEVQSVGPRSGLEVLCRRIDGGELTAPPVAGPPTPEDHRSSTTGLRRTELRRLGMQSVGPELVRARRLQLRRTLTTATASRPAPKPGRSRFGTRSSGMTRRSSTSPRPTSGRCSPPPS
jgi:hypothetical protein